MFARHHRNDEIVHVCFLVLAHFSIRATVSTTIPSDARHREPKDTTTSQRTRGKGNSEKEQPRNRLARWAAGEKAREAHGPKIERRKVGSDDER